MVCIRKWDGEFEPKTLTYKYVSVLFALKLSIAYHLYVADTRIANGSSGRK